MKNLSLFIVAMSLCGCVVLQAEHEKTVAATQSKHPDKTGIVYKGGDGSSPEKAVIIMGAADSMAGIRAESIWIRRNHPGWRSGGQALLSIKGKHYDRITCTTPKGEKKNVFFDITDFFGKW